jgi:DNA gyrase subunit B/topoisomerase-4 subunit B
MSAARHAPGRSKLLDCLLPGPDGELFVVEGDSALESVASVRHAAHQGVLAFQGKPLNAWRGSAERVDEHVPYRLLAQALGLVAASQPLPASDVGRLRYGRVLLLFDPDADGIHSAALLAMYFQRWQPALVAAGRIAVLRAPMFEIVSETGEVLYADHPAERDACVQALRRSAPDAAVRVQAHRGLGSIRPSVLRERCVEGSTRRSSPLTGEDVEAFVQAFGRGA